MGTDSNINQNIDANNGPGRRHLRMEDAETVGHAESDAVEADDSDDTETGAVDGSIEDATTEGHWYRARF